MRHQKWLVVGWLALACLGAPARAEEGDEPIVNGRLGREIERAIEKAVPDLWGSVLVARNGEILFAKGYGFADYQAKPNTTQTMHELASASKQVTAAAILHLQQRRKLKLEDKLGKVAVHGSLSRVVQTTMCHTSSPPCSAC